MEHAKNTPVEDPALIADLRHDLEEACWTVEAVDSLLSPGSKRALERDQLVPALRHLRHHTSAPAVLTRLFVLADDVPEHTVAITLPTLGVEGAVQLGLVRREQEDDARLVRAMIDLRPHAAMIGEQEHQWWVASDLSQAQTGRPPTDDHVLGIAAASTNLLRQTMRAPVTRALDLGCGSGILALYLSTHADEVVATDISARACAFTRFNAALNQVAIDVRQGSLFDPVKGEKFDLITSNPPFVITPEAVRAKANLEYRDGGELRDNLIPLILKQAVLHLETGGAVQMLANWEVGTKEDRWATRPRRWIEAAVQPVLEEGGSAEAWLVQRDLVDVAQYAEWWMRDQWGDRIDHDRWRTEYMEWIHDFARAGASYVGLGTISVRVTSNRDGESGALTLVSEYLPDGPPIDGKAVEVALANLTLPADWEHVPLTRAADVREVRYYVPGSTDPELVRITQGRPGGRDRTVTSSVAALIGVSDGELTARQVVPAIAMLSEVAEDQVWNEVEDALPELLRSGVLLAGLSTSLNL